MIMETLLEVDCSCEHKSVCRAKSGGVGGTNGWDIGVSSPAAARQCMSHRRRGRSSF